MQRWIIAIGILGTLPGPALAVAQVSTPQDSLKNLEALRVEVTMARNPSAARRGVDADYVRNTVELRLDRLDLQLLQGEDTDASAYLSVALNPARISDGYVVSLMLQVFQPARLANSETVMAATWYAQSLEVSDAEGLQDYVRNALQHQLEMLASAYQAANER